MALSKKSSHIFSFIWSFNDFLYYLQLQEYYSVRYFLDLPRFFWRRNLQERQQLEVTSRIKLTKLAAIFLMVFWTIGILLIGFAYSRLTFVILLITTIILAFVFIPLWVGLANLILTPVYQFAHNRRRRAARAKIKRLPELKIIAIAGSFGKTTTKNFVNQLIQHNYRVQMIPGNINTPTGIAGWVNQYLAENTQVLVAEMDTYNLGEIKESCLIAPPDIAVVTNIGDQHLLRFGERKHLAQALLEVYQYAKPEAKLVVAEQMLHDLSDLGVAFDFATKITVDLQAPLVYQAQSVDHAEFSAATHSNLVYALKVAEFLNIPSDFVKDTLTHLEMPERRQELSQMRGFDIIDDSYNISPTTAVQSLEYAKHIAQQKKLKLLVITGGIPELGMENSDANYVYGKELANQADELVILETILAPELLHGIDANGFDIGKVIIAERMSTAWDQIEQQFKPSEILVLMQPELTDLYY